MNLINNVAIVTGGASGIGKEIVIALLDNGIKHVAIFDINKERGTNLCSNLTKKYGNNRVIMVETDITCEEKFDNSFQKTISIFNKIDIVINNAGIVNEINYERMINLNLTSTVRGIHLGRKYLSKKNGGHGGIILNVSSMTAFLTFYPCPVYAATKSGIVNLVRAFGHPYHSQSSGVSIMALCPGYTPYTALFEDDNVVTKEMKEVLDEFVKTEQKQSPDSVGRAAVHVLKHGDSGSIWIVDGGNLYKINIPDVQTLMEIFVKDI